MKATAELTQKKHIRFPSIGQFRNVVSTINHQFQFVGLNEDGEAIYDRSKPRPVLTFTGTVKIHGTNASVCFNALEGMWFQSRDQIITPEQDNAGFARFASSSATPAFAKLFKDIAREHNVDLDSNTITIYGEWAGQGIQSGTAISNLSKTFFLFGIEVTSFSTDCNSTPAAYWVDHSNYEVKVAGIFNILNFPTYIMSIDFNMPQLVQNELVLLTEQVEAECPVAKAFNQFGIGEGIVWSTIFNGNVYRFKVKGEKHSVSKVKVLASVDVEKMNSIVEFIDYAVTETRLCQAITAVFGAEHAALDVKRIGDVIRWVVKDVTKEEGDVMIKNGIVSKEVNKYISNKVRTQFFALLASKLGL